MIREYYPYIVKKRSGFTFDVWHYSRDPGDHDPVYTEKMGREVFPRKRQDDLFTVDSVSEWTIAYKAPLAAITTSRFSIIDIVLEVKSLDGLEKANLACQILLNGKTRDWQQSSFIDLIDPDTDVWQPVYLSVRVLHSIKSNRYLKDAEVRVLIWNEYGEKFRYRNLRISVRPDNPSLYGLYFPMK